MKLEHLYTDCFHSLLFWREKKILVHKWIPGSVDVNFPILKGTNFIMAGFCVKTQAEGLLVDAFGYLGEQPTDDFWQWRSRQLAPILNQTLKKMAFLWLSGYALIYDGSRPGDIFPARNFTVEQEALYWLTS